MRRRLFGACVATAAAGLLLLVAAGRAWGEADARGPVGARQHLTISGRDIAPALSALAIALLALAVAMLAARGVVRRLIALLVVVAGAAAVPVAIDARSQVGTALAARAFGSTAHSLAGSRPGWWIASVLAGVVAAGAGALVVVRGGRWSGLGARYDAPATAPTTVREPTLEAWDALDRGQDPTAAP